MDEDIRRMVVRFASRRGQREAKKEKAGPLSFRRKPENIHVGRYVETWHKLWPVARRAVLGWRPRQARGDRPRRFERPSVRPPREKGRGARGGEEKKKK